MLQILKKIITTPSLFRRRTEVIPPGEIAEEKWVADFSKPKQVRFDIKSESSYDANLQKAGSRHCLSLGLKKSNYIAWIEVTVDSSLLLFFQLLHAVI